MAVSDKTIRCFQTPLENMLADELNELISYFVFEVKKQDGREYPANSLHSLVSSLQRYLKTQCGKIFDSSMTISSANYVHHSIL